MREHNLRELMKMTNSLVGPLSALQKREESVQTILKLSVHKYNCRAFGNSISESCNVSYTQITTHYHAFFQSVRFYILTF